MKKTKKELSEEALSKVSGGTGVTTGRAPTKDEERHLVEEMAFVYITIAYTHQPIGGEVYNRELKKIEAYCDERGIDKACLEPIKALCYFLFRSVVKPRKK